MLFHLFVIYFEKKTEMIGKKKDKYQKTTKLKKPLQQDVILVTFFNLMIIFESRYRKFISAI